MRGLLKLVGKEWRDVRAITAASAVLVVAACLGVRWFLEERYGLSMADFPSTPRHFDVFVPACAALYATLIAADVVGGEVASRRIDLVELLPAGRGRVWLAKALFLLAASVVFTVWCALVQWGVLLAIDGAPFAEPFVTRALGSPWVLGLVATFAGATLLVSTVGLRGLAAALVGGVVALSLWIGVQTFASVLGYGGNPGGGGPWIRANEGETIAALWLPPALLAAAGLGYRLGRVHLGRVLRPSAIALGVVVAALAGPGAALAYDALAVVPGRPGTVLRRPLPSPDGRFVALPFVNTRSPAHPLKVFVLDTARDVLVEPECGDIFSVLSPSEDGAWAADGSLAIDVQVHGGVDRAWIDPVTGAVRRRESLDLQAWGAALRRRAEEWQQAYRWHVAKNRRCDDGGPTFEATAVDTQSPVRPQFRTWAPAVVPIRTGRLVYFPEPCVLAVRKLPDGEERRLLTSREPWRGGPQQIGEVTQDGRLLLVEHDGTWKSLDLETGATRGVPPSAPRPSWWHVHGDPARRIILVRERVDAPTVDVTDVDTGARMTLPADAIGIAFAAPGGRLVVVRDFQVLDLVDLDLKVVRRLWPVGKE